MGNPKCIVCGKTIPKKTNTVYLYPASEKQAHGSYSQQSISCSTLHVAKEFWPRSIEQCKPFTNGRIVSVQYHNDGTVSSFGVWDGESYQDKFFHSQRCAMMQGYAAAEDGHRWRWKIPVDE